MLHFSFPNPVSAGLLDSSPPEDFEEIKQAVCDIIEVRTCIHSQKSICRVAFFRLATFPSSIFLLDLFSAHHQLHGATFLDVTVEICQQRAPV